MENIFWKGYSNDERLSSINTIKEVIAGYGDIVDFKLFSDVSLTVVIEIAAFNISKLYDELSEKIGMEKFDHLHSMANKERTIYLNITFSKGTGNFIIEVPAVPG